MLKADMFTFSHSHTSIVGIAKDKAKGHNPRARGRVVGRGEEKLELEIK